MKSDGKPKMRHSEKPAVQERPGLEPNLAPEPEDTSPHRAVQAERGVMHPDRDDMEWRYWRGGWGRLTE